MAIKIKQVGRGSVVGVGVGVAKWNTNERSGVALLLALWCTTVDDGLFAPQPYGDYTIIGVNT